MLFEVLAGADGMAGEAAELELEELELEDGGLPYPYWALTITGSNTAVNARDNFMVVGKGVTEQTLGLPRKCKGCLREGRDGSTCREISFFLK